MREWGIPIAADTRLSRAHRQIANTRSIGVVNPQKVTELASRVAEAHRTIMEFYSIVRAITGPEDSLFSKIPKALVGHDLAQEDRNPEARNYQFELFIASLVRHAGIPGIFSSEPDFRIRAGTEELGVAAKRLVSTNRRQVEKRVAKAIKQLKRANVAGFIALNLDELATQIFLEQGHEAAQRTFADTVEYARAYVQKLREDDLVFAIYGFATVFGWIADLEPAQITIDVTCHAAWIAHPPDHRDIYQFTFQHGRHLDRTLSRLVRDLDSPPPAG